MKLITIQNKNVFSILVKNKTYIADFEKIFDNIELDESAKFKSYQILMKHYNYTTPPIFCCIVDKPAIFRDIKDLDNSVILELEVPTCEPHVHLYFKWLDILHYTEYEIWDDTKLESIKTYLDGYGLNKVNLPIQAVIPYIKPEWLVAAYRIPVGFIEFLEDKEYLFNMSYNKIPIYKEGKFV